MKTIRTLLLLLAPFCVKAQKNNTVQSASNDIKLSIIASWTTDTAYISFQPGATSGFDSGIDILKNTVANAIDPSISTICTSQDLYKNALPVSQDVIDIPIRVKVGITGKYILQMDSNAMLSSGSCVMLEDLALSYMQDLRTNASYSFAIADTTNAPRFILHIGRAPSKSTLSPRCSYTQNGAGIITSFGSGSWDCAWLDSLGNILVSRTNIVGADTLKNLAPGVYPVIISGNSGYCNSTYNDTIIINPAAALSVNALINHVNCPGANTGMINASMVTGGQAPYSYSWSNNSSSSIIQNLNAGVYILVLSDANGCNDTTFYSVQQLSNLAVNFSMSADTLTMVNPTVMLTNQSSGQTSLSWNFGDGSPYSTTYNPNHTYSSAGTFTVELTASDAYCTMTKQQVLVVLNPTGIHSANNSDGVNIYSYDGKAIVKFDLAGSKDALINIYSMEGKLVNSKHTIAGNNSEELTTGETKGIYLVEVEIGNNKTVKKILN